MFFRQIKLLQASKLLTEITITENQGFKDKLANKEKYLKESIYDDIVLTSMPQAAARFSKKSGT